ncbi:cysteine-rich receptor-like protein kinase 8 [Tanacetum coccineum]
MSEPTPLALFQNLLYLHPSNGPSSLTVQENLTRAQNYRAWRRAIEIGLSTKRKLGFIKGTIVHSATDANLAELNGSIKYKLNKDTYEITQDGCIVGEYYTKLKCVWEELDNINVFPVIAVVTPKILVFLVALNKKKEEQRLFQFLNGLEDHLSHQRSQILMIDPVLSVENACSLLQQEESQRLLFKSSTRIESSTFLSKGIVKYKCSICGFKWHPPEKYWEKDLTTKKVTGLGRMKEGLYHLFNVPANKGNCVTTASYLINSLPSYVVGNLTPYEILLKKKLDYAYLRVFGYLAMVSNPSRTADEFDPRGVPCVFLVQKDPVNLKEAVADPG